ncbi:MAG: flagellar motor protein MotB [Bdellovibrionales bacterium]
MRKRRWQKKGVADSHADDWLMTYADLITLLLCFFAIFLSVSVPKKTPEHKLQLPQPEVVVPVAPPPDILEGNLPLHGVKRAQAPTQDIADELPAPPADRPEDVVEPTPPDPQPAAAAETETPPHAETPIPPATLPEIVDRLKFDGPATIEQKGDRITTIDISSAAFFDSGSATLSGAGKTLLLQVAGNLKAEAYKDYQITVEGHTDDQPIRTAQFPSNWELSTGRAAAVVQFFLGQGIAAQKLRAAGYADTFPVAPNRDAAGKPLPDNQARNRRVVIKLEKIDKAE